MGSLGTHTISIRCSKAKAIYQKIGQEHMGNGNKKRVTFGHTRTDVNGVVSVEK